MLSCPLSPRERVRVPRVLRLYAQTLTPRPLPRGEGAMPCPKRWLGSALGEQSLRYTLYSFKNITHVRGNMCRGSMSSCPVEGKREQCQRGPYAGTDVATVRTT